MNCKKCHKTIPDESLFCLFCGKKQETQKRKKARRVNGSGTIRVYANRKKKYAAFASSDRFGHERKYIGSFPTYADAQRALDELANSRITDVYNKTLADVYELWSKERFDKLAKDTVDGYRTAYKYLKSIANIKIRELKKADYQRCIDECAKTYSRAQCQKIKVLCSQLCKYAMENDVIDKNYAEFITLPKEQKKEREKFSSEDLEKLWQHSDDSRVKLILILCYTGLRINEFCNIRKRNVNLDERYLIAGSKTEAGTDRYIPISSKIYDFVVELYQSSGTDKLYNDNPSNFRKRKFYPCLSELGIIEKPAEKTYTDSSGRTRTVYEYESPRFTPHCTRHTFASLAEQAGINPKELQAIIGHAKYETTANIYIHSDHEKMQKEMQKL